ncbi:MAG: chemotaxis protein CheW [Cyanobacteria bacterium J06588_5]
MDSLSRNYIFFKLKQYSIALPSENILKIVATPPPSQGGMVSMGLVQLQQYSIQILNLEELLGLQSTPRQKTVLDFRSDSNRSKTVGTETNPPFLIVMRSHIDEDLWGIAVNEPPELMNIPDRALSPVPEEVRLPGALQWVSHVVTRLSNDSHAEISQTLLVLDLPILLSARRADIDAHGVDFLSSEPPLSVEQLDESFKETTTV